MLFSVTYSLMTSLLDDIDDATTNMSTGLKAGQSKTHESQ